jgi:hypothetical protein
MTKSYSALSNTRLHSAELMSNILHVQQLIDILAPICQNLSHQPNELMKFVPVTWAVYSLACSCWFSLNTTAFSLLDLH